MFNLKLSTTIIFIVTICCINIVDSTIIDHLREIVEDLEGLIENEEYLVQTLASDEIKNCFTQERIIEKLDIEQHRLRQDKLISDDLAQKITRIEQIMGWNRLRRMENRMSRRIRPPVITGDHAEQMTYTLDLLNSLNFYQYATLEELRSNKNDGDQYKEVYLEMMRIENYNEARIQFEYFERNVAELSRRYNIMVWGILDHLILID